jgi:predicted 3-demethylubiquinone-9 3-methyltransferase (glyoxalase superfamily)
MQAITPCLWFDHQAEEAARWYVSIFPNSAVGRVSRYTEAGREIHGRPAGSVMLVDFHLSGRPFSALNGGPVFRFTEAISLVVPCDSQQELDRYWNALSAGGDPEAQQCGWLKDRYGVSWQIVPAAVRDMLDDPDREKAARVMQAVLQMKKLDLRALQAAFERR